MIAEKYLHAIPWSQKSVASGKADHVPRALEGLISSDEKLRERSYWQLDNEVVLQSDLYEAAYFVIPFLIQCLREGVPHGRDRIYDLLTEIGGGCAPSTRLCVTREGDSVPLQAACVRELLKGFRMFLRDTADQDARIATKARELVQLVAGRAANSGEPEVDDLDFHLIELAQEFVGLVEHKVRQSGGDPDQISVYPSRIGTIKIAWQDHEYENEMDVNRDGSIGFKHRNRQTGTSISRSFSPLSFVNSYSRRRRVQAFRQNNTEPRQLTRDVGSLVDARGSEDRIISFRLVFQSPAAHAAAARRRRESASRPGGSSCR